jgi:hypothetical protein
LAESISSTRCYYKSIDFHFSGKRFENQKKRSRSRLRNQVIDFDDDVEEKSMFIEPPDIGVNGDGNPSLDFYLGR